MLIYHIVFFSLHVNLFLSGIYLGRKSPLPFHQKKFSGGLWWMGITTDFTLIPLYEGLSLAKRVAWRTSLPVSYLLGLDCCEIKLNSHELIKKRVKWLLYLTSSCRVGWALSYASSCLSLWLLLLFKESESGCRCSCPAMYTKQHPEQEERTSSRCFSWEKTFLKSFQQTSPPLSMVHLHSETNLCSQWLRWILNQTRELGSPRARMLGTR